MSHEIHLACVNTCGLVFLVLLVWTRGENDIFSPGSFRCLHLFASLGYFGPKKKMCAGLNAFVVCEYI